MSDDPQTLAQRVRTKYPGAYDDLSDQDLEAKVKAKYPGVYDDLPTTPTGIGQQLWNAFKETGPQNVFKKENLPLIGAAIAGAATGGGGAIPVLAASGLGGAAGEGLRQAASGEEQPNVPQMALEGAKQAAQVGIGEGLGKGVAAGIGLARTAAAGAAEGGFGGAVARVVRNAAPIESVNMMIQALKPRNSQINFPDMLKTALPEIKAVEQQSGKPITSVDELIDAVKTAKKQLWSQWEQAAGPKRAMGSEVDGAPIADAIERSIPSRTLRQDPAAASAVQRVADTYRQKFQLQDAEQLLKETNAALDAYYAKFPAARQAAETANPEIAHLLAEAKGLRAGINNTIDAEGEGAAARELKRRYGALSSIEDAAQRRSIVAQRQQPESLSEQIGKVRAAGEYAKGLFRLSHGDLMGVGNIAAARAGSAASTFLKEQQTTDMLIQRAMAGHSALPTPIPPIQQPVIRGLLGPGATPLGPATVGGLDPSDVPGITVAGQYGAPVQFRPGQRALPPGQPEAILVGPRTVGGLDPSDVPGITQRGVYGKDSHPLFRAVKGPQGKWNVITMTGRTIQSGLPQGAAEDLASKLAIRGQ